jgi:hypothetical protein
MSKSFAVIAACVVATAWLAIPRMGIAHPADLGITIEKIVVATAVADHEPSGEAKEFPASAGTLYCWTKVNAKTIPATIKHKWYRDDKQVFEYSLDLKFNSTRTWSSKSVTPGKWRVDVTDEGGTVLSSVDFVVK